MTDTSKLVAEAAAISKQSPAIKTFAQDAAANLVDLAARVAKLEMPTPPTPTPSPTPTPTPVPPPEPPDAPVQFGPWYAADSPWRTPIPSGWQNWIHPDTAGMVSTAYLGTNYSAKDVHAFGYDLTDMTAKWGANGPTFMKFLGPGPFINVVYAKASDSVTRVYMDYPAYKASFVDIPGFPSNWAGYNSPPASNTSYYERRTYVVCDDGRAWILYQVSPPGTPPHNGGSADSNWHATAAFQTSNWDTGSSSPYQYPSGGIGGGSGIGHGAGTILPSDFANLPVGGWIQHALAFNAPSAADGTYTGVNGTHYAGVWPSLKGFPAGVAPGSPAAPQPSPGDGKTKNITGIPHGARVFLDPSLTDSDLQALGCTKEWMLVLARTMQRYGCMSVESMTGQGDAGAILCESNTSIAWNAAQGNPGYGTAANPFKFPWVADGTASPTGQIDNSYYASAFPSALVPGPGVAGTSHWKVFDWRKAYPGITIPG